MSIYRLSKLLAPRSVALVGGSPHPGSVGQAVLRNIRQAGFDGPFGVVNSHYPEIAGLATVGSLAALPFVPELVVITAPAEAIPGLVEEAGRLGCAGALIISSGLGHGPGSLEAEIDDAARRHHMRIIGPNCIGVMMPGARLNASFAAAMPRAGNLALISQSGAIVAGMVGWAEQRGVGFSGVVSIGDQLDVDIADLLDYFALDGKTKAILLYVEAIKDARKFMSAARAAARVKPVIVIKSGRMAQGAQAAATHTGALAGADAVYDAAFRQAAGDPDQWRWHRRAGSRSAGRTWRRSGVDFSFYPRPARRRASANLVRRQPGRHHRRRRCGALRGGFGNPAGRSGQ
jgi:acetyltransferase